MAKKGKESKASITYDVGKGTGKSKTGITCIGEICFDENGFKIKLPEDADPECARRTAELILAGNSNVVFEVPSTGIVKSPEEMIEDDEQGS